MGKDFSQMEDSNDSGNPTIHDMIDASRRTILRGGLSLGLLPMLAPLLSSCTTMAPFGQRPAAATFRFGFQSIPTQTGDRVVVPPGYVAEPLAAWGEPVGVSGAMPPFKPDASNTADEQALQMGMHHDAIEYYPLAEGDAGSTRGLLVMNHEYADDGLLHPDGMAQWSAEKVRKSQAAHGIAVIEVARQADGRWTMLRPSRFARRFTAFSPFEIKGPAAGHPMMQTRFDPAGRTVLGTLNNCAGSKTPWGTYLSGEENFAFYFAGPERPEPHLRRWGIVSSRGIGYRWHEHDERFDAGKHPNEPNRFGWIVEVDPMDPNSTPVKRTALGRAAHEGATVAVTRGQRAVVYCGEDARFEYIYKFVSRDAIRPGGAKANAELLDHGTLYVARFDADGTGQWMPLTVGMGPLTAANGFSDQAEVLIKSRQASDLLGATKMDRPEWIAVDPINGEVYCTLTNNTQRQERGPLGADPANPRANNVMGQIVRWKEEGDFDGLRFRWEMFVLAGDPANERAEAKGNIRGDIFACPDGLAFDPRGVLWIQTDAHATQMYRGEFKNFGNNMMLAADVTTGEVRRFLTGPTNSEITGVTWTPDLRSFFVNIQHPGETPSDRSDPREPSKFSRWPDGGRPRSATVVIRRLDGGAVGT